MIPFVSEFCAIANDRATRKNSSVKLALMGLCPINSGYVSRAVHLVG